MKNPENVWNITESVETVKRKENFCPLKFSHNRTTSKVNNSREVLTIPLRALT